MTKNRPFVKIPKNHFFQLNLEKLDWKEMCITFLHLVIQEYNLHIWIQYESIFHNQVLG